MRTIAVINLRESCGTAFAKPLISLREGCGTAISLVRERYTQVLDFIAGRLPHFCGKVRVARPYPLKGVYPAGLLEVGPAGIPDGTCVTGSCHSEKPHS